jgi:hypothetical protein
VDRDAADGEVTSPLNNNVSATKGKEESTSGVGRRLFQVGTSDGKKAARKRKPRREEHTSSETPDLNLPLDEAATVVPSGLVSSRVHQLGGARGCFGGEEVSEEMLKKQKRATHTIDGTSAAAADGSPRRAP